MDARRLDETEQMARRSVPLTCLEGWLRGEVFDLVAEVRRLRAEVEFLAERVVEEAR